MRSRFVFRAAYSVSRDAKSFGSINAIARRDSRGDLRKSDSMLNSSWETRSGENNEQIVIEPGALRCSPKAVCVRLTQEAENRRVAAEDHRVEFPRKRNSSRLDMLKTTKRRRTPERHWDQVWKYWTQSLSLMLLAQACRSQRHSIRISKRRFVMFSITTGVSCVPGWSIRWQLLTPWLVNTPRTWPSRSSISTRLRCSSMTCRAWTMHRSGEGFPARISYSVKRGRSWLRLP